MSSVAAALLVMLLVFQNLFLPTNNQLYKRNYQPISGASYITRGQAAYTTSDIQKGISLYYNQENYQAAWTHFSALLENQEPAKELILFASLTQMGLGDFHQAIKVMEMATIQLYPICLKFHGTWLFHM